ncbi:MAG: S-adenosyl-L-homocysteine hydrolase [Chloroflexi bacterium]|nr:MAG: S-adenosyl-L-homocysteine hydrolase [Chloroflexota bacterium]
MSPSRIKDAALAAHITQEDLAWQRYITPITEHYIRKTLQTGYTGKTVAIWMHVTFNALTFLLALHEAGARVTVGACNPDSTHDATAAYLATRGLTVYAKSGMSDDEYHENLQSMRAADAMYLCDTGGEVTQRYANDSRVVGGLEATTSGLMSLKDSALPFPVFEWNSIPLKNRLENRLGVGNGLWPAFSRVTSLSLFGKRVLVVGYGPVGKGIAERARNLGALVFVADTNPIRALEARHFGCETVSLEDGLAHCEIIVTATGATHVLHSDNLPHVRPGAIVCNAGHSRDEFDIAWLYQQPHRRIKAHIERFDLATTHFYLLARGNLLNLAVEEHELDNDLFDHYSAIMLRGLTWMMDGLPHDIQPGLQQYPPELEREIAALSVRLRQSS